LSLEAKSAEAPPGLLVSAAAAVALLYVFRSFVWPLALAIVIVIVIQALLHAVVKLWPRANRRLVLLLAGAAALALILAVAVVALPRLAALGRELPSLLTRIDAALIAASARLGLEDPITLQILIGGLEPRAVAVWMLGGLRGVVSGLVLTSLFVVFLLICWESIGRRIRRGAGPHTRRALATTERAVRGVETYLWIQTLTSLLNAAAAGLVMFSVGLNHWQFWAGALFVLAYIPFLGVAVGSVAPALLALLQFPSGGPSIVIFLAIQAIAFVVGNLIAPRMQATTQNLDPTAGLLAVGVWTILWGLPGAFLAIPLTLTLIYLLAASPTLGWLAILMSNDGFPLRRSR
jgi:predicted PurR-regulated permease PerM